MAEGIYARNFSDIFGNEIVYDCLHISVRDKLLRILEVIMHVSCDILPNEFTQESIIL